MTPVRRASVAFAVLVSTQALAAAAHACTACGSFGHAFPGGELLVDAPAASGGGSASGDASYPEVGSRWTASATNANIPRGAGGNATLTWSIARDGTNLGTLGSNTLIQRMDGWYGSGPGGADLTQRPWFNSNFKPIFDRYNALLGINFVYEPGAADGVAGDDGAGFNTNGALGVRGDIRFFGSNRADGTAFGAFPNNGDTYSYLSWNNGTRDVFSSTADWLNVTVHEVGHTLGLAHQQIFDANGVRDANASIVGQANSGGAQFDDLIRLQRAYGDFREKGNGNDSAATADAIGPIGIFGAKVGTGITNSIRIANNATDIVSIDGSDDVDWFGLDAAAATSEVSFKLIPKGPTKYFYQTEGQAVRTEVDATAQSSLILDVFAPNGATPIYTINNAGLGGTEQIDRVRLPALPAGQQYFVRARGVEDAVQFYELNVNTTAVTNRTSARLILSDTFGGTTGDAPSTNYHVRQAAGRVNSTFNVGTTDAVNATATIDAGRLKLRSVGQGVGTGGKQRSVETARNLAPELSGKKWGSRFFVDMSADAGIGDSWFGFTFNDANPVSGPFDANAELSMLIRPTGAFQAKGNGGGAGKADVSGTLSGTSHVVELFFDETGGTKLMTLRLDGVVRVSNQPVTLNALGRYFGLRNHVGDTSPAGLGLSSFVDDFAILENMGQAAFFNVADGGFQSSSLWSGGAVPGADSDAFIVNGRTASVLAGAPAVDIGGDLWVGRGDANGTFAGGGTLNVTGNAITVANSVYFGATGLAGAVNVTGGTLAIGGDLIELPGANGSSSITLGGGTLDLGLDGTPGAIVVDALTLNTGTLRNVASIVANVPQTNGQVVKNSTGTLTIAGTNLFTNAIIASNGTLVLDGSTATGGVSVNANAIVRVTHSGALGTGSLALNTNNAETGRVELGNNVSILSGKTLALNARNSATPAIVSTDGANAIHATINLNAGGGNHWIESQLGSTLALSGIVQSGTGARTLTLRGAGDGVVSGVIQNGSGTIGVAKADAGTWRLANADNAYTLGTSISAGMLEIARLRAANGSLSITGGAARLLDQAAPFAAQSVNVVPSLSITAGNLDIANTGFAVDYAGTSPLAAIEALVASAYAGGTWAGSGIFSGSLFDGANVIAGRAIGVAEGSSLASVPAAFGTRDATSVLLRVTLKGDASLDGVVNFDDLLALAQGYGAAGAWINGDSNYDATVNFDDLLALAQNYGGTFVGAEAAGLIGGSAFAADWAMAQSLVPEPATLAAMAGALLIATRRRR